ncbi:MAG: HAMP domain-containing histidine kinase [Candidatus Eisenbacteria bacterium]|uniref:histidine kinase n=1 Tax=Eiseniibacteriota bacterium TaxID=2212470 RepID=A0A538T9A7_UNCEI|nr:MAG: HAMP domain-containing histidine kinase [Candidatus Eisenbacteria bacterium]
MDPGMLEGSPFVLDPDLVADDETTRALEADLRLAAHLRALSRVSAVTAHDIRTPLHTVILYLELLRNTIEGKSKDDASLRQERYVEVIGSEIRRLERMLDGLLGQTRVTEDSRERFDLADTARDLHSFLDPYCRRSRVQVLLSLPEAPVVVDGNRDSIKHALIHILLTALEGLPDGGELGISLAAGRGKALFTLTGAAPGAQPAILDSSGGPPQPGRALGVERGLYAARRAVERHGGSIKVRSRGRRGPAGLEIQLPLAPAGA